ncbi:MAG: Clp protease N-terminal domain-containing protein [Nitriliruptor sp.]
MMRAIKQRAEALRTIARLLPAAEVEAQRDGRSEPAAEDLVLAALALPDGAARRALASVGCDPDELRAALAMQHADALRATDVTGDVDGDALPEPAEPAGVYRSTGSAQELFQEATRRHREAGAPFTSAWLLLVGVEREKGPLARAFVALGLDRDDVARAAASEIHHLETGS